ncbi:hypothetical protein PsYK624_078700 [Phanerochaete sordida]|uniref:Uncharacterized protein n=1 Tax=Phanerochaete sordida TaxID=48140 RepID=A0A9P3LDY2_9APHY|nr:hypothetical protein PsYK624_078700 [Phanerochaete sordida]
MSGARSDTDYTEESRRGGAPVCSILSSVSTWSLLKYISIPRAREYLAGSPALGTTTDSETSQCRPCSIHTTVSCPGRRTPSWCRRATSTSTSTPAGWRSSLRTILIISSLRRHPPRHLDVEREFTRCPCATARRY